MERFNLDQLLRDKKLQQNEFAQMLDITPASVSIIRKRGTIKYSLLRRIEDKFGSVKKYSKKTTQRG